MCGEPKQEVTFAGMVNELHKALCDITEQDNLQPNIITSLCIANGDAEHSNEHAYYQLSTGLQSHSIVIKALEADDRNTQKQIDSQQAIGISQILFTLVGVVLGAIFGKFL